MNITLYKNISEVERVGKTLTNSIDLNGSLRNESRIINPSILIEHDNISDYNYAYIPEFNRYYFIKDMISIRNNLWQIELYVDVLESYKDAIKQQYATIKGTQDFAKNKYLPSEVWVSNVKETTTIRNFPNGLSETGEFILITAGG